MLQTPTAGEAVIWSAVSLLQLIDSKMAHYSAYILADLLPILMYWVLLLLLCALVTCGPEELRKSIFEAYLSKLLQVHKKYGNDGAEENDIESNTLEDIESGDQPSTSQTRSLISLEGNGGQSRITMTLKSGMKISFPPFLFLQVAVLTDLSCTSYGWCTVLGCSDYCSRSWGLYPRHRV